MKLNPETLVYYKMRNEIMDEQLQFDAIAQNVLNIGHLKAPTEAVQMAAIQVDPSVIYLIDAPCVAAQLACVEFNPTFIKYINHPCIEAQRYVIEMSELYGSMINEMDIEIQKELVDKDLRNIRFIQNCAKEIKLHAIEKTRLVLHYIDDQSDIQDEITAMLASDEYVYIRFYNYVPPEHALAAIQLSPDIIWDLSIYEEDVIEFAVNHLEPTRELVDKMYKNTPSEKMRLFLTMKYGTL